MHTIKAVADYDLLNFGRNIFSKKLDSLTFKLLLFHAIITHIKFEVFFYIFGGSGLLCAAAVQSAAATSSKAITTVA